jgi:hypothetical protein
MATAGRRPSGIRKVLQILGIPFYRRVAFGLTAAYLLVFLFALQDFSLGGEGIGFATVPLDRMFDRTGTVTFEPIARLVLPGITFLISPLNLGIGVALAFLAGLNLTVTWIAFRQPKACRFNRSTGVLATLPALLAGSACCAPAILILLGIQATSMMIGVFQVLIPASMVLLLITLKLILDRTEPEWITR